MPTGEARAGNASGAYVSDVERLKASPQLFANPLLDKFSRMHWWAPLVVYTPITIFLAWLSFSTLAPASVVFGVLSGYVIWTLFEYFCHKYVFHMEFKGKFGAYIHHLIHGVHHEHPNDPLRLVTPLLMSAPVLAVNFLDMRLLFGLPFAYPTQVGFMVGYLLYDMVHYYLHHGEPKTGLGRHLRRRHMLHHFHDESRGFGVSAPWWDKVFGTEHTKTQRG
jgi:dihydroceramide fatty acyl 2-hydroxylase